MTRRGHVSAWVGLGSNLGGPVQQICRALRHIDGRAGIRVSARSSLYRNPPMGPADQPDYVNAVARLETTLTPLALLRSLQGIEREAGRIRDGRRWGARVLDLDLLLWGNRRLRSAELTLPHPGLPARAFVLYPLAEIDPQLIIPGFGALRDLLSRIDAEALERVREMPEDERR